MSKRVPKNQNKNNFPNTQGIETKKEEQGINDNPSSKLINIKLKTPLFQEGQEIAEINLDLNKMKAGNMLSAGSEFQRNNPGFVGMKELQDEYALRVASKLSGINYTTLLNLEYDDFSQVTKELQVVFLYGK